MNAPDRPPTADELAAMAYADGELAPGEREIFEGRLDGEPHLLRAVSEYRRLEVLARTLAPPEPADREWARLSEGLGHRATFTLGGILLGIGLAGLTLWICFDLLRAEMDPTAKVLVGASLLGIVFLFLTVARRRLRTLPHDPYRNVKR